MVRNVEQRPVLFALVRELLQSERLQELAEALPTSARVSEPALPLVVAALHEQLDRSLTVLVPEDADARDLAEAAAWFLGPEHTGLLPSRGVRWDSGLQPPPHLVGERARALDVLEGGGLVVVSATAIAEGMPRESSRPAPIRIVPGEEVGIEQLTESLAFAGYERVERAEDRGQFAVRGGLVDVFPTTGRDRCASSSSETKSSRCARSRRSRSARFIPSTMRWSTPPQSGGSTCRTKSRRFLAISSPCCRPARPRLGAGTGAAGLGGRGPPPIGLSGATKLDQLPAGSRSRSRHSVRLSPRADCRRPRTS